MSNAEVITKFVRRWRIRIISSERNGSLHASAMNERYAMRKRAWLKGGVGEGSDVRDEEAGTSEVGRLNATRCGDTHQRQMFETVVILVELNLILFDCDDLT